MLTDEQLEKAAYKLCELMGVDPKEMSGFSMGPEPLNSFDASVEFITFGEQILEAIAFAKKEER